MLIIKETGCRGYGNSLYCPLNFSVNLKNHLKNRLLKKKVKEKNIGERGTKSRFCEMGADRVPAQQEGLASASRKKRGTGGCRQVFFWDGAGC